MFQGCILSVNKSFLINFGLLVGVKSSQNKIYYFKNQWKVKWKKNIWKCFVNKWDLLWFYKKMNNNKLVRKLYGFLRLLLFMAFLIGWDMFLSTLQRCNMIYIDKSWFLSPFSHNKIPCLPLISVNTWITDIIVSNLSM